MQKELRRGDFVEVKSAKEGGKQIEFEDELPEIREMYEKELAKLGLKCRMPIYKK